MNSNLTLSACPGMFRNVQDLIEKFFHLLQAGVNVWEEYLVTNRKSSSSVMSEC